MLAKSLIFSFLTAKQKQLFPQPGKNVWLSLFFWMLLVAPAQAALELRVAIQENANQVKIGSSTKAIVRDAAGKPVGEIAPLNAFVAEPDSGRVKMNRWQSNALWVEPTNRGFVWIGDRWYRGRTLVVPTERGLTAVNYVDLERYLYSVLGGEVYTNWPQEALKAQAVAARTYALYQRQTRGNRLFDVGNTIAWQVYRGVETESPNFYSAVDSTAGQVLTYRGQLILAAYHAASGGHTENVENVWGPQALPYLRAVPDFDQGTPGYQWTRSFTPQELSSRISGVGQVQSLTPERVSAFGRVLTLKVVGDKGSRTMSGAELQRIFGLRSTWFSVTPEGNNKSLPTSFRFNGRGFGHGIGLSQWGAYGMARQGANYQQILQHYYRGASLARINVR
jgi:stage II sporulation protein D